MAEGEFGWEKDTGKIKIGDGITAWNSLPYSFDTASASFAVYSIDDTDSPYTISETAGEVVIFVDTSGGAVTVNLPTAVGNTAKYNVKLITGGNTLTIDPDTTETVDGSSTIPINVENTSLTLVSDNSNYFII